MASGPITKWQIDGERVVTDFISLFSLDLSPMIDFLKICECKVSQQFFVVSMRVVFLPALYILE